MPTIKTLTIEFEEFPRLVKAHRDQYPQTSSVEEEASSLIKTDFSENDSKSFVRSVCKWGGYAGVGGRVILNNESSTIASSLRHAHGYLAEGKPVDALRIINNLKGLGKPSFASKHLRFLAPQTAVILDSVISQRLDYRLNLHGYAELLADCARITTEVNESDSVHPFRSGEPWYISDIELGIFAKLQGF